MNRIPKNLGTLTLFILLILALIFNIVLISGFLLTLFIGWLIAEIMMPLHKKLQTRWKIRRNHSALIVTLVATLGIILPLSTMTYFTIQKTARIVEQKISEGVSTETFTEKAWSLTLTKKVFENPEEFETWVKTRTEEVGKKLPALLSGILGSLPGAALQLTLALLTCFFVLKDGSLFTRWIAPKIPLEPKTKAHLAKSLAETAVSSAVATFWAALAQASTLLLGFLVLGLQGAALIFGVSFLCAWIPLLGVGPVWMSATVYLFATGSPGKAFVMIAFGIVSGVVDNIVLSWVLKGRANLHPLISLFVIFGSLEYFGIFGIFVGPVLVKLLIECLEIWAPAHSA